MRIGESVRRPDGPAKASGRFEYSSDLHAEGMLWGATTRSPHAHARIKSIDISAARAMPGAVQCGFCTPGFVVATDDLLKRKPNPTEAEIREALAGNICRCTGYAKIIDAVNRAAGA